MNEIGRLGWNELSVIQSRSFDEFQTQPQAQRASTLGFGSKQALGHKTKTVMLLISEQLLCFLWENACS